MHTDDWKPSFFSLLRPHPKLPNQTSKRRSIFDFFREKLTTNIGATKPRQRHRIPEETPLETTGGGATTTQEATEAQREAEVEQLRKRGWIPPGLVRRHRSLKERLRAEGFPSDGTGGGRNPFFGSSKSVLNRAERKKAAKNVRAGADTDEEGINLAGGNPFSDENAATSREDVHGPIVLTEEDIDDFLEIEAPTSTEMANMPSHERSWTRFKPSKDRRNKDKDKGKVSPIPAHGNGSGGLGNGAEIVQKPRDAFPDSPHHRAADAIAVEQEETEVD